MAHNNRINWNEVRDLRTYFAFMISTVFGTGLLPKAPGTFGTLVAIPLVYYTGSFDSSLRFIMLMVLIAVGTWAATAFGASQKNKDHQAIVIDEVAGFWITAWLVEPTLSHLLIAAGIFRFFDIVKLYPVSIVDRWSKIQTSHWKIGWGVMADDLIAGVQGFCVIYFLQRLFIL